jgi:hypothetical protein
MQAFAHGWREVGKPVTNVALRCFFAQRLDLAIAIACSSLVTPAGLGLVITRGVRLIVAAQVARGPRQAEQEVSPSACHGC